MKKKGCARLIFLGHKQIPSRQGGVEIVVEELAVRMAAKGYDVTCLNRNGQYVGGKEFYNKKIKEYKGVKIKNVLTIEGKGVAAVTSSISGAIVAAFSLADVVHFHAEGPCAMLWLPKIFGKKCIATIHGLDHRRSKWNWFASNYIMLGEKCAAKFADEIIVLSKSVQDYFREVYNRDTVLIPNGVTRPLSYMPQRIKEEFGLEKDEYFLYLARLVPEKGLKYLIEAFKKVNTNKKLVIAGGSSDTNNFINEIHDMAKDDNRILFTGFVSGQILDELYSNAYTYVLPSDLEGMPLSLLEAMSYGNCCLVSSISECKDVVEDKAEIFEKGNTEDLKEKLQKLNDHPELVQKYREKAADFICDKYHWDDVVDETLRLYKGDRL